MADDERFLSELLAFLEHSDGQVLLAVDAFGNDIEATAATRNASCGDDGVCLALADTAPASAVPARNTTMPTATTTATTTTATMPIAPRPKTARNVTRDRLQRELRQLRAERLELENALAALHAQRTSTAQPSLSLSQRELLRMTWQRIAQQQQTQRERAEAENAHLRAKVAQSVDVARALQQSAVDWLHSFAPWSHPSDTSPHIALTSTPFADMRDVAVYKALAVGLGKTAQRIDGVLRDTGLDKWRGTCNKTSLVQLKTRPNGVTYLEVLSANVFPYPRDVVVAATQQVAAQRSLAPSCAIYNTLPLPPNVFAAKSRCNMTTGSVCSVSLEFLSVTTSTNAAADDASFVTAWHGVTTSNTHFPGAAVDETGWQVVRSVEDHASSLSVVLTITQLEPRLIEIDSVQAVGAVDAPLTTCVLSAFHVDTQEVNDRLLDALLRFDTTERAGHDCISSDDVVEVHV